MKEANRKVGGLYTMFVRGDTMGGTIKEAGEPSQSEAASEAHASQANNTFDWKSEIRTQLRQAAGHTLPSKQLRKAVVAAASKALGIGKADLRQTYSEQLPRTKRVVVDDSTGSVRLAPKDK